MVETNIKLITKLRLAFMLYESQSREPTFFSNNRTEYIDVL